MSSPVKDIVEDAIANNKVAIFSKSWCPYCKKAKATIQELVDKSEIDQSEVKVLELDELKNGNEIQEYLANKTGQRTVPNIFINKGHVGGNDNLQAVRASGKLQTLLATPA